MQDKWLFPENYKHANTFWIQRPINVDNEEIESMESMNDHGEKEEVKNHEDENSSEFFEIIDAKRRDKGRLSRLKTIIVDKEQA